MGVLKDIYFSWIQEGRTFDALTEKQLEIMSRPLPAHATKKIDGKKYSALKTAFVTDLFNEVFGHGGWVTNSTIDEKVNGYVVVNLEFLAPKWGIFREAYGGNQNLAEIVVSNGISSKNSGSETILGSADSTKGAISDATNLIGRDLFPSVSMIWRGELEDIVEDLSANPIVQPMERKNEKIRLNHESDDPTDVLNMNNFRKLAQAGVKKDVLKSMYAFNAVAAYYQNFFSEMKSVPQKDFTPEEIQKLISNEMGLEKVK